MPTRVKSEKVRKTRSVKEKQAPAQTQESVGGGSAGEGSQQTADVQGDDDRMSEEQEDLDGVSDEDENETDEDAEGSPNGAKRARVNDSGYALPVKKERKGKAKARPVTLPRDTDGYVPGSIVRVKLRNFVTYDDVEFRPGPYLNMVLGPNGTGKSSIACAICLGLNWPPSILGRAAELRSFVKHGYEDGFIEIELKGPKGHPNLVIRRNLKNTSKGSTFDLNGEHATAREISARVMALNVQVGNLCSFLPQDKVAEFAQMTPQQLLKQTQSAAGDENLSVWHKNLIESGKELKMIATNIETERGQLETLEQRNSILERDVQQYKQRRLIEREVELLELLLPFKEYLEAKAVYADTKKAKLTLHDKVTKLMAKNKPVHDLKAELGKQFKVLEKERDNRKKAAQAKFLVMKKKWQDNEKYEHKSEEVADKLSNLRTEERQRKERIQTIKKDIHKIENELAHPPEMEDLAELDAEHRKNNENAHKNQRKSTDLAEQMKAFVDDSERRKVTITRAMEEIQNLDNVSHRRLEDLSKWDKDCADVVRWLRQNQNRFKMEVFEPPIISLSVPDQEYAEAVEACFSINQLKTFVAQCQEDYTLLHRLVTDTNEALGRKVHINTWFRPKRMDQLSAPPVSLEEMRELGFDKYAVECVECPDGLLWYLKRELNMHRTAIGLNASNIDTARAMEAVSRLGPRGDGGSANFVAGHTLNSVQRSRYGKRVAQNNTKELRGARNLKHPPVDLARKREIERQIEEARTMINQAEEDLKPLAEQHQKIEAEYREFRKEKEAIDTRRKKVLDIQKRIQSLGLRLKVLGDKLEKEENAPSLEHERETLRRQCYDLAKKRANIAKELKGIIQGAIEEQTEATRVGLTFLQVGANKAALEELAQTRDREYHQARADFDAADELFNEAKRISKIKLDISKRKLGEIDDELRATFEAMEKSGQIYERDSAELQQELENQKAKLELNSATNAGVIEQYEKRQSEIEELRSKVKSKEDKRQKVEKTIETTKDRWLPALQTLVTNIGEKFSAAFDRVGCAGEIRLTEHEEDYDKWAIDILVKFRDNEKLQLLTGQRQSGGERALTTIMYLMSLTELARAPFSLVDEINQGMDQRYERAVHNSLVEVTCKPDSGQYFLITPKLLTDLKYHERMKVLCVNNGEWLPGEDEKMDGSMMKMIDTFVAKSRNAAPYSH